MILNDGEIRLLGPALKMLEANDNLSIGMVFRSLNDRVVQVDAVSAGITIRVYYSDEPPNVEHYAKPMGFALAYGLKRLEDLYYPKAKFADHF